MELATLLAAINTLSVKISGNNAATGDETSTLSPALRAMLAEDNTERLLAMAAVKKPDNIPLARELLDYWKSKAGERSIDLSEYVDMSAGDESCTAVESSSTSIARGPHGTASFVPPHGLYKFPEAPLFPPCVLADGVLEQAALLVKALGLCAQSLHVDGSATLEVHYRGLWLAFLQQMSVLSASGLVFQLGGKIEGRVALTGAQYRTMRNRTGAGRAGTVGAAPWELSAVLDGRGSLGDTNVVSGELKRPYEALTGQAAMETTELLTQLELLAQQDAEDNTGAVGVLSDCLVHSFARRLEGVPCAFVLARKCAEPKQVARTYLEMLAFASGQTSFSADAAPVEVDPVAAQITAWGVKESEEDGEETVADGLPAKASDEGATENQTATTKRGRRRPLPKSKNVTLFESRRPLSVLTNNNILQDEPPPYPRKLTSWRQLQRPANGGAVPDDKRRAQERVANWLRDSAP